jgi:hypothetical protein
MAPVHFGLLRPFLLKKSFVFNKFFVRGHFAWLAWHCAEARPFACARSRARVSAVRARILPVRALVAWRVLAVRARISQLEFSLHGAVLNHFFGRERAVVWSGRRSISFPI